MNAPYVSEQIVAAILSVLAAFPGAPTARAIDAERSTVTVRVFKSGLFRAFADDHVVTAAIVEGTLDDSTTPHVELVVDASRMHVLDPSLSAKDREQVQARMLGPEVLDTNRFPQIRFRSTSVQPAEKDHWLVHGAW